MHLNHCGGHCIRSFLLGFLSIGPKIECNFKSQFFRTYQATSALQSEGKRDKWRHFVELLMPGTMSAVEQTVLQNTN